MTSKSLGEVNDRTHRWIYVTHNLYETCLLTTGEGVGENILCKLIQYQTTLVPIAIVTRRLKLDVSVDRLTQNE
jgi:hypothetical protein